jgi:hypothetical protein
VSRDFNATGLARELGVHERILFTRDAAITWTDADLDILYRSCEIGLNTASGEAWGLTAFEHAAHGGAQILPKIPVQRELWGGAPVWLPAGNEHWIDPYTTGIAINEDAAPDAVECLLDPVGPGPRRRAMPGSRRGRLAVTQCRRRALAQDHRVALESRG